MMAERTFEDTSNCVPAAEFLWTNVASAGRTVVDMYKMGRLRDLGAHWFSVCASRETGSTVELRSSAVSRSMRMNPHCSDEGDHTSTGARVNAIAGPWAYRRTDPGYSCAIGRSASTKRMRPSISRQCLLVSLGLSYFSKGIEPQLVVSSRR